MIIDVQDRVDNLIHKVEGFLKDIKQEKESLDREVLLEEKPFKVNEYTEGDIEWEDFDDDVKTQIEEGTSISDLTRIFNGFLKIRSEELRGNKPKVSVLRDGRDFLMRIEDGYTLRVVLEEFQRTRDSEIEEDDEFEGMSITFKEKDSEEEIGVK